MFIHTNCKEKIEGLQNHILKLKQEIRRLERENIDLFNQLTNNSNFIQNASFIKGIKRMQKNKQFKKEIREFIKEHTS